MQNLPDMQADDGEEFFHTDPPVMVKVADDGRPALHVYLTGFDVCIQDNASPIRALAQALSRAADRFDAMRQERLR